MIERPDDFPEIRQERISKVIGQFGLTRVDAVALADLQYANEDFEMALGEDWKSKLDAARSEAPNDPNSMSNRLLANQAKTYSFVAYHGHQSAVAVNYASANIEHLGKNGQFEDLSVFLSKNANERIEYAYSMGNFHGMHPAAVFAVGGLVEMQEKVKKLCEKAMSGAEYIGQVDKIIESNFDSTFTQNAARVVAVAVLAVAAVGIALAFGHTVAATWALKETPAGKLAIGAGAAIFALYKEYADPPKDLMKYLKDKKQYEKVVSRSERQEKIFSEQRALVESDTSLTAYQRIERTKALQENCGAASIREVQNALDKFHKLTDERKDLSLMQKISSKWSNKALLKYQSFDDLQKLAEDFNKGLASNFPIDTAMNAAIQKRMEASPSFKQKAEAKSERLMLNVAKGVVGVGAGLALGGLVENKFLELYAETLAAGIPSVLSQKLPDPSAIAKWLHDKRVAAMSSTKPAPPSGHAFS